MLNQNFRSEGKRLLSQNLSVALFAGMVIFIVQESCTRKITEHLAGKSDLKMDSAAMNPPAAINSESNWKNYLPDTTHPEFQPMIFLKVNVHFVQTRDSIHNFTQAEGREYAHALIDIANNKLAKNEKMFLPHGNSNPAYPTGYRYMLTPDTQIPGDDGIYFHKNDTVGKESVRGKHMTIFSDKCYVQYGNQKGRVLNIFILEHDPDSVKSKTYHAASNGYGPGYFAKIIGCWWLNHDTVHLADGTSYTNGAWFFGGLLNHEIGHCLGLNHTWNENDHCDDTPFNPGCWNVGNAPCDSQLSNNVMDYNAWQSAFSPCQLGRIHFNFHTPGKISNRMRDSVWCHLDSSQTIFIGNNDTVLWKSSRDLNGNLILGKNAQLRIQQIVSIPPGGKIILHEGARLIIDGGTLTNACGKTWKGIFIEEKKKHFIKPEIIVRHSGKILLTDSGNVME